MPVYGGVVPGFLRCTGIPAERRTGILVHMPRPESPEGKWVTIPVRVREALLVRIDGVRGECNRSEWMRGAAEAALGMAPPVMAAGDGPYVRTPAGMEPAASPEPPRKPRPRAAAAPKTVTPASAGVPAVVLQPPEPERAPEPRQKAPCKHPGVGRKQRCRACGAFNV